jgi:DNA-directed RNA polymerase specialized sigma24 family protein
MSTLIPLLPPRLDRAHEAYHLLGLTQPEIAARFGVRQPAIAMRLQRAMKIVRKAKLTAKQRDRYFQLLAPPGKRAKVRPLSLNFADQ